jgi:hypothetical protein
VETPLIENPIENHPLLVENPIENPVEKLIENLLNLVKYCINISGFSARGSGNQNPAPRIMP